MKGEGVAKEIKKDAIHADGIDIGVYTTDYVNGFISLTDIAKKREGEYPGYVIQNWMRSRSTIYAHRDIAFEFASWISPEF